jgi:hypothetical protein
MNAIKPFPKTSVSHNQYAEKVLAIRAEKKRQQANQKANLEQAIEASLKILVNIGISYLAIMSIKALLPYHTAQKAKLTEIDLEINKIKPRVELLEEKFSTTFAPQKAPQVMQKNSYKVDPNLTRIFFTSPTQN